MRIFIFILLFIFGINLYAQSNITIEDYFNNIFTFNGPLLSVLQAITGTYIGIMLTKILANKLNISKQKEVNQLLLITWSIGSSIVLVGLGIIGLYAKLPPYIYYPLPTVIALILPKYIFDLSWKEEGIYILLGTLIGLTTHILFSLFVGYNNYLPFWKIDSIWASNISQNNILVIQVMQIKY